MFIEITHIWLQKSGKEARELINIQTIKGIEPLPEKNGYGEPQSGSRIKFIAGGSRESSEVVETYEELSAKIEWAQGRTINRE